MNPTSINPLEGELKAESSLRARIKKLVWRYIKYNIVGLTVFLINIVLYVIIFPVFGEWSYIIVSVDGGVMEFALITYINKTKKGIIFEACPPTDSKSNDK